jgi:hypothetical protein
MAASDNMSGCGRGTGTGVELEDDGWRARVSY